MNKTFKIISLCTILIFTTLSANAGMISRIRNWFNSGWDDPYYGYPSGYAGRTYTQYPYRRPAANRGGVVTGFTPSIVPYNGYYPSVGNYHSPIMTPSNRFNHLPYGMPQVNTPTRRITDFNTNVGTRTGVTILD